MTAETVQEIYRMWVQPLSVTERLRLATLILNDVAPALPVDEDDAWSEQDYHDLSAFSLQYAFTTAGKGNDSSG